MANGTTCHTAHFHGEFGEHLESPPDSDQPIFVSGQSQSENACQRRNLNIRQSLLGAMGITEDEQAEENNNVNESFAPGVFLDVAAMKDRVRDALKKPTYNVQDYYSETGIWQRIAKSVVFEQITLAVIGFNAIWIAVDTDSNDAEILLEAHLVFQLAENLFCVFFSFELLSRFMAFKRKRSCLRDTWFLFDAVLVFMMVVETWVMSLFVALSDGGGGGGFGNASVLRIARLLRLSRMARMVRLLRIMPELMIMIKGMVAAIRSVFFTLLLLVIIMYIFGIAFTQLLVETEIGAKHYSSVPVSMYTLLIYGTLLDDIGSLTREMGEESIPITGLFMAFVLLAALTVMNMLIGVLCEVVSAVAATEKEEMLITWVKSKIEKIFEEVDMDGSHTVTRKEFVSILENALACRALQDVGVDVVGLVDFADAIFEDEGRGEKELTFHDFMDVVLQLRGCNNATVKDIVDLRKLVQKVGSQTSSALLQIQRISTLMTDPSSIGRSMSRDEDRVSTNSAEMIKFHRSDLSTIRTAFTASNGVLLAQSPIPVHSGFVPEADGEPPKAPESTEPWASVPQLLMTQQMSRMAGNGLSHLAAWEPLTRPLQFNTSSKLLEAPESTEPCGVPQLFLTQQMPIIDGSGLSHLAAWEPLAMPLQFNTSSKLLEASNWHGGVNSDHVRTQIGRLDDALYALANVRNGIAGCAALDFKPDCAN